MTKTDEKRFVLRLPGDLYVALQELAEEEMRSVHGETVFLLKEALIARGKLGEPQLTARERGR